MAGDKTYIEDSSGNQHRATRTKAVTPESIVWSSNPNDYTVQVRIDGKWHRAILTYDVKDATFFDNINIDKALVTGGDGKTHTALIVSPEASDVVMSSIPTDEHSIIEGTTTGETVVNTYSENWSNVVWQDNVNVYKVLVEGSDGKKHTALLTTNGGGGAIEIIVKGTSPLSLPDAIANSLEYLKAFGGTEQRNIPQPYTQVNYVTNTAQTAVDTGIMIDFSKNYEFEVECRAVSGSWYILQSRASSSGNITGIHGATSGSTITLVVGNVTICTSAITRTVGNKLYVKATLNNGVATLYVKDETAGTEDTQTGSYGTSQPNPTASVYLLGNAGGQYADVNSDIYMARIKENDTVVMDYVPARQVATAGFYDTVSGTFKTAITASSLVADGDVVPSPETPMDIVSNNGVLKASSQLLTNGNCATNTNNWVLGSVSYDNTDDYIAFTNNASSYVYIRCNTNNSRIANHTHAYLITGRTETGTMNWGSRNAGGASTIIETTEKTLAFIDTFPENGSGDPWINITAGGTFVLNKKSGFRMFDLTALGLDAVITTPEQAIDYFGTIYREPKEIYADGTVETIRVHGKNLFDVNSSGAVAGYLASDGSLVQSTTWSVSDYIPIKANTTFTYSTTRSGGLGSGAYLAYYDANRAFISTELQGANANKTFTTPAGTAYIRVSFFDTDNWQVELGSTATPYEEYFDGGTATAEMLLKVGTYQDVQSIIDGAVTRNVGVKVLDGTEGWTYNDSFNGYRVDLSNYVQDAGGYCTHFQVLTKNSTSVASVRLAYGLRVQAVANDYPTIQDWTNYLKAQYNAGTPVIIVYPLATPTTETVTGQPMQVQQGDNFVEITQASLDNLELEAKYQAAVSLTIQEVQDANLDPNVQVTIN